MTTEKLSTMSKVDFHFSKPFTRADFLTDEQYDSFMDKAKELKIQIINDKDYFLNKSYNNFQNTQNNENIER